MTKAIIKTYDSIQNNLRLINYVFISACLLLLVWYSFSIFSIISKTVAVQKIETEINILNNKINDLDSEYLALTDRINLDKLSDFGMKKGQVSQYITRTANPIIGLMEDYNHVALVNER